MSKRIVFIEREGGNTTEYETNFDGETYSTDIEEAEDSITLKFRNGSQCILSKKGIKRFGVRIVD